LPISPQRALLGRRDPHVRTAFGRRSPPACALVLAYILWEAYFYLGQVLIVARRHTCLRLGGDGAASTTSNGCSIPYRPAGFEIRRPAKLDRRTDGDGCPRQLPTPAPIPFAPWRNHHILNDVVAACRSAPSRGIEHLCHTGLVWTRTVGSRALHFRLAASTTRTS